MALTQNIGRFTVTPLAAGHRLVATPSNGVSANVDPILIDPAELDGEDGKSAYQIAVDNGFVGTESAWLLTLKGSNGPPGSSMIYDVGAPTGVIGIDGDSYVNESNGDLYWKIAGNWVYQMNIKGPIGDEGPTGPAGGGLVPDQYTNSTTNPFNEAYIAAVVAAGVTVNILIDDEGDQRSNNTIPAALSGNMDRHLVRYDHVTTAWNDIGPFVGIKGEVGPKGADGVGTPGTNGSSAYAIAVAAGFVGTEAQWLDSLDGDDGKSAYQSALDGGFVGTEAQWLASLHGDDGDSAYDVAVTNGFVGNQAAWLASLEGSDGENAMPNEVVALTEAKITAIQTAGVDWLIVASPDNRVNKTLPAALNGDQSRMLLKYKASTTTWSIVGRWQGNDGLPGTPGDTVYGVDVFLNLGVASGGYWVTPKATFVKSFTKFYATVYAGTGTFDAKLFVNGTAVYTKTGITTAGFDATGLALNIAIGDAVYIEITVSASTVLGVWAEFS